MQTVNPYKMWLLALLFVAQPAAPAQAAGDIHRQERAIESGLLHRRLDLSGLRQWNRTQRAWLPARLPPGGVLVIHLWSIHCAPCIKEFPILARIVKAWRTEPEVKFLMVNDPPDDATEEQLETFWRRFGMPELDPIRSNDGRIRGAIEVGMQPLTLLLDSRRIIRHVFAGSLQERNVDLTLALERLLRTLR